MEAFQRSVGEKFDCLILDVYWVNSDAYKNKSGTHIIPPTVELKEICGPGKRPLDAGVSHFLLSYIPQQTD